MKPFVRISPRTRFQRPTCFTRQHVGPLLPRLRHTMPNLCRGPGRRIIITQRDKVWVGGCSLADKKKGPRARCIHPPPVWCVKGGETARKLHLVAGAAWQAETMGKFQRKQLRLVFGPKMADSSCFVKRCRCLRGISAYRPQNFKLVFIYIPVRARSVNC